VLSVTARLRSIDARGEQGFALPELLVAIIIGTVIVLAAFGLLDTAVSVGTKVNKRVDATQRGRVAMAMITRDLRSQVCLPGDTPLGSLRAASDTSVDVYADLGDGSAAKPPQRRTITFDAAARKLNENIYTPTGSAGSYVFPSTPTATRTLLTDVVQDGTTPVFRYYPVDTTPDNDAQSPAAFTATSGLTAAQLEDVARIVVVFKVFPAGSSDTTGRTVVMQDEVYRRAVDPNATDPTPECW
jgi:prepilin-type N-terminal cleavage/methylation domain-containing protein